MLWSCTCIAGRLRPSSPMKIKNKILIAGVLIPLVGRSSGKSSASGSGTCVWNWDMLSIPLPCARHSLPPLPHPRHPHQTSGSPHHLPMDHLPSRKCGSKAGCRARTLHPNRMAPCAVLPTIPSIRRPAALSAMGRCASCMLLVLAIVVGVRYGSTASGTAHPPRNHGVSVRCSTHKALPPRSTNHPRSLLRPAPFFGEIGHVALIGASW